MTQTGRFVGTLDYVAPEQISGAPIDARVDVYALGCLLFKLLTGEVPFPKEGEAARLYAHLHDPPPAPSLYVPEISMAFDDVVIRAMSKQPDDRYPSAGDLGRAAQAALRGETPIVPERTVATGAAATRTAESIVAPTAATRESGPPTDPTRRLDDEAGPSESKSGPSGDSRRRAIAAGIAALVVAVVVVVILLSGGGDGDRSAGGETGAGASTASKKENAPTQRKPEPLSKAKLIAKADDVCADSQRRYVEVRSLESEMSADVPYAEALVRIARARIGELRELVPPPPIAGPYEEYVAAQERVYETDKQALAAARKDDVAGVEAARDRRDSEDALREELAREIGFNVCSTPQS